MAVVVLAVSAVLYSGMVQAAETIFVTNGSTQIGSFPASLPNNSFRIDTSTTNSTSVTSISANFVGPSSATLSPSTGWTQTVSSNFDDANHKITFGFNTSFNGTSFDGVFISSNTYLTFGTGSSNYSSLSASNPAIRGVHMCADDNSYQKVFYKLDSAGVMRVRYEGHNSTSGTVGSPTIVYEAVFYSGQSYFDLHMGSNSRCGADVTAPTITSVSSNKTNGSYKAGEIIDIDVTFSENVTSTGNVTVTLETGATDQACTFTVSNTNFGTCNYTVQAGDTSADLTVKTISGTIKDPALNTMTNFVPATNLAANKALVIDTTAPTVTGVTSSLANGSYKSGQVVPIEVVFSESVTVSGTPRLVLVTGSPTVTNLSYASGSGTATLVFNYTVGHHNYSADLDYGSTSSLSLNNGTIRDTATNNAILTLASPGAAGSLGANKAIVINNKSLTVAITSTAPPLTNTAIPVSVTFSASVTNFVVGDISVSNGTAGSFAGSGATYTFSVTPTANGSVSINIPVSVATNTAGSENTVSNTITKTFDNIVPTVAITTLVASPTSSALIAYTATFSEAVTGFALADISVTNAVLGNLNAVSSTVYTFDVSPIGHMLPVHNVNVTVSVPSSSAIDAAGNNNSASDSGVPAAIAFDNHNPTVSLTSAVAEPTNSGTIDVTVSFSEGVTGFTVGDLSLTNATVTNFAVSSSTIYTFKLIPSGQGVASVFVSAGVSQDSASNLNLISNTLSRLYDSTAPTVALTSSVSDTTSSSVISVTATFSEIITGFVVGDLSLTNTTVTNFAGSGTTYTFDLIPSSQGTVSVFVPANISIDEASNNNIISDTLSRIYDTAGPALLEVTAVAASDYDTTPDYVFNSNEAGTITYGGSCSSVTASAVIGDNTITFDTLSIGSYNDCNITVTDSVSNISNILVLTNFDIIINPPPTITSVSSDKANGSYTTGEVIDIDVTFSEAVTSTGNVTITLETGATDRTCTFSISSSTTGTCNYTVQASDATADLTVNTISGTIVDAQSDAMVDFVPTTNLAANKAIVIDTTAPTITSVSSDVANGTYTTGEVIDIDVTFSEVVTSSGNVTITLETGATDRTCTFTITSSTTGTCNYTVQEGDATSDLTVNTISGTIADAASNAMVSFAPATNLAANKAIVIDTTAPKVIFSDNFNSSYVTLASHVPSTVGTGWTQLINNGAVTIFVQSYNNYLTITANASNSGTLYTAEGTYPHANYEISSNISYATGSDYTRSMALRVQDANNMYLLRYDMYSMIMYKRVSGTWTQIGSASVSLLGNTSTSPYSAESVSFSATGTTLVAKVDGVTKITVTDSSITGIGKAGVGLGYINVSTDDSGTGVGIDNVVVQTINSDTTAPTITSVSSDKPNGTYTTGEVIDIDVTFSEAVTSTGNVTVTLETGATDRTCTFTITSASTGTCNYTVQAGDTTSDLTVNTISGTIADASSNAMTNFAPATNLATNKALVIDTTAPTASTLSPLDDATGVSPTSNLVITFNETVTAVAAKNLTIKKTSDGSTIETISVTGGLVSGSGSNTITINPSTILDDVTEYYVFIDSGAFIDAATNIYAGISSTTAWSFTTADTTAPTITNVSSDKANGTYTIGEVIDIDVTFSEVVTSTGNVTVTLETGATDRTCTFTVTSASTGTCNYTVQAGDTTSDLTVNTISGTIADASSNAMTNFAPATNLATNKALVIDTTAPTASTLSPLDDATGVSPTSNLVITFNETVTAVAAKNLTIKKTSDGSTIETISVTGGLVSGSGSNTITINPSTILDDVTEYYVFIDSGAFIDAATNIYAGISSTTAWSFIVADTTGPIISEVTSVATPGTDSTPNYTFITNEAGTISYGGSCGSATTSASLGSITITFNTLADGTYTNCTITVTDASSNPSNTLSVTSFTIDTTAPIIVEVTPVTTPTEDSTPNYTFTTDEDGTLVYGGSCNSVTTSATVGNNTITFNTLAYSTYSDCTITLSDLASNASNTLAITAFKVAAPAVIVEDKKPVTAVVKVTSAPASNVVVSEPELEPEAEPEPTKIILNDFTEYTDSQSKGKTLNLTVNQVIYFSVDGGEHSVTIKDISDDGYATFVLASTPRTERLKVGETGRYDVNDDGSNDVEVSVLGVNGKYVDMTFKQLAKPAIVAEAVGSNSKLPWLILPLIGLGFIVVAKRRSRQK